MPAEFAPVSSPGALPRSPAMRALRHALRWVTGPVLAPGPASMRNIALAAVVANAVIMSSGAAVRLSQSGLGCPDWPKCTQHSLAATHVTGQTTLNTWIEFGNRLVTYPVVIVAFLALIAAWQYRPPGAGRRRTDLVWLAGALPAGVAAQAVLGGIVVLTKLNPVWVSIHFLVSTAVVGVAVWLHVRSAEGTGPARYVVRPDLRVLGGALVAVTGVMIAAGTVVSGTGPHAGNAASPRYPLPLVGVTQFHADIGWLIGGLAAALLLGLRLSGAPRRIMAYAWVMGGLIVVQGAVGYAQYFSHLPAGLAWVHVTTAVCVWIAVLRVFFAMRDRGPAAEPAPAAGSGAAAEGGAARLTGGASAPAARS